MTPTGRWKNITPTMINKTPKSAVKFCGPNLVFEAKDVSDLLLRSTGSMALLCAGVNSNIIKLIGRWRSDDILCYLYVQVEPIMRDFSKLMITHGNNSFMSQQEAPCF